MHDEEVLITLVAGDDAFLHAQFILVISQPDEAFLDEFSDERHARMADMSRRDVFRTTGIVAVGAVGDPTQAVGATPAGPDPYTRIGVRPFINCTATYTINGGSQMLPEVIAGLLKPAGGSEVPS